jgi:hypothetical protein
MRKNKYNNNGKGSSIKERKRGAELELLQRAGIISDLQTQVPYELIPAHYEVVNGKRKCIERACTYKADFVYYDVENKQLVVEDSKGFRTKDYIIKRKLMLHVHGIKIKET